MQTGNKRFSLYPFLRNIFFLLLIIQFTPGVISSVQESLDSVISSKDHVGYLKIEGEIQDSAYFTKQLEGFEKDDQIKAVLVKFESPGGYPASAQAVFKEIQRLKKKKPVVAFVENLCASGGYYIAAAASKIIANPSSLIGGIGVVSRIPNVKGLFESWHVNVDYVTAGKYKATGAWGRELTPDERDYLQNLANDSYDQFIADIARSRGISAGNYKAWAEGKVFTGNQALGLKLIDVLGSFSDAVAEVKKLANIDGEIKLVALKKRPSGLMRFITGDEDFGSEYMSALSDKIAASLSSAFASELGKHQMAGPRLN